MILHTRIIQTLHPMHQWINKPINMGKREQLYLHFDWCRKVLKLPKVSNLKPVYYGSSLYENKNNYLVISPEKKHHLILTICSWTWLLTRFF